MTRTTFSSSFISSALFCNRPAVSTKSTSRFPSRAADSALKARLAESEARAPAMTGDLVRSPQIFNCSIAAATKGSPAASITLRPSAENLAASLPMVVVLPEPLTPTTRMTNGFCAPTSPNGFPTRARNVFRPIDLKRLRHRGKDFFDLDRDNGFHVLGRDRLVVTADADGGCDARRHLGSQIGAQQHILDIVQHRAIELALGDEIGHRRPERTRRALQPAS